MPTNKPERIQGQVYLKGLEVLKPIEKELIKLSVIFEQVGMMESEVDILQKYHPVK